MLTEKDLKQLAAKGIPAEKLEQQLNEFKTGFPFLKLEGPAAIGNGILAPTADEVKKYVKDMDILYTDTWLDMEFFNDPAYQERKAELMKKMLPYQLNSDFIGESKAIVLHDMPMHVGFEISEEIEKKHMEHILDQAENRRHAEKAVMYTLLKS